MSDTRFAGVRKLLDLVMQGQSVGEQVWMDAKREIDVADPMLEARSGLSVQVQASTEPVKPAEVVIALGEIFSVMERFIHQGRTDGYLTAKNINNDDANRILYAKSVLVKLGYVPTKRAPASAGFKVP